MIDYPPRSTVPPRGHAAGWRLAALVLGSVLAYAACKAPAETVTGLLVVASGSIEVANDGGSIVSLEGAPSGAIRATASADRIVVQSDDGRFAVSDPPSTGTARTWRALEIELATDRSPSGIDLSPDGRTLAIALGDPDTAGMDVALVDVETGAVSRHFLDLMANGPPAWIASHVLVLEVIRPDQLAGIATLDTETGDVTVTPALGIEASATRDGSLVAVSEDSSEIVVRSAGEWLAGISDETVGVGMPPGRRVLDIALDAAGERLGAVFAGDGGPATVVILRRTDGGWENGTSIEVAGDGPVVIDWLD